MRLVLTGRHVEVTPALRRLVERKVAKLERVLNDSLVSVQIILAQEKYRRIAEVVVHARGDHLMRGIGGAERWPGAVGEAIDRIAQQAHTLKGKWLQRKRRATSTRALAQGVAAQEYAAPRSRRGATMRSREDSGERAPRR